MQPNGIAGVKVWLASANNTVSDSETGASKTTILTFSTSGIPDGTGVPAGALGFIGADFFMTLTGSADRLLVSVQITEDLTSSSGSVFASPLSATFPFGTTGGGGVMGTPIVFNTIRPIFSNTVYTLTQQVTLNWNVGNGSTLAITVPQTSLDFNVPIFVMPEPATSLMVTSALTGVVLLRRKLSRWGLFKCGRC
jgi:hypothetical protein